MFLGFAGMRSVPDDLAFPKSTLWCKNSVRSCYGAVLLAGNSLGFIATDFPTQLFEFNFPWNLLVIKTHFNVKSRERHASAPYLRLKNSKRTSKCQVFFFTVPEAPKSWTELASRWLSQNIKKLDGGPFEVIKNFSKKKRKGAF